MSRRMMRSIAIPALLSAGTLLAISVESETPLHALQDEAAETTGPEVPVFIVPDDLIFDTLIDEVGEETATALSPHIQTLFNRDATDEERLQAAAALREAAAGISSPSVKNRLLRRVDLVEAGIKALQNSPDVSDAVRQQVLDLVAAASEFETQNLSTNAEIVRQNYRQLRDSAPAVTDVLRPVMMQHYFNHNLHVTVSETVLSRLVSDYQCKTGSIADCIMGAWVTGSQVTNVNISADIKPSSTYGRFNLIANGQTQSNTVGRKQPATVYSRGNHYFHMVSPVTFTGETLSAGPATINVDANVTTVGARTDYDRIPIFGSIARKIALKKAREMRGRSEAISAYKLASEAVPEFQQEVNERFAEANSQIQTDLLQGLRNKGVAPDTISSRSSETHLAVSSRTLGSARLGGSPQPFSPVPYQGMAVQLHETAVNNGIDGLELNGRDIPEDQLDSELEKSLSELLQRDIKLSEVETQVVESTEDEEPPVTFLFSDQDPIRFRFENGQAVLMLRMGIRQENREDIPEHHIEVPIDLSLENGKLRLTPPEDARNIKVAPIGPKTLRLVAQAAQIRRILKSKLPTREVDPVLTLKLSDTRDMTLRLIDIQSTDGWLYTEFQ